MQHGIPIDAAWRLSRANSFGVKPCNWRTRIETSLMRFRTPA
jgi:hypothetical protein